MPVLPENMIILDSVDSTNNYAMALIRRGAFTSGKSVFAREQTYGKGRLGRQWKSHKDANIILSVPVQMQWLPVNRQFELSMSVALACHDLLSLYLPGKIYIKWPNDLFINDTKAGGVLIENRIKGTLWQWSVIGVGLNINQEDFEELGNGATSLKLATGTTYPVLTLASELHQSILRRIGQMKTRHCGDLLREYNTHLFALDQVVRLKKGNAIFETRIKGVSQTGQLITGDSLERRFNLDEIGFMGISE